MKQGRLYRVILYLIILFSSLQVNAKQEIKFFVRFPRSSDSVKIELFKCYLSNIQLIVGEQRISNSSKIVLLDFSKKDTFSIVLDSDSVSDKKVNHFVNGKNSTDTMNPKYFNLPKYISFQIGIDSIINTSGLMEGDLDPIHGMYWTWQSGYINFKIEGHASWFSSRNHEFQYHVGGYRYPYLALKTVELQFVESSPVLVGIDMAHFLNSIKVNSNPFIMSPSAQAVLLAEKLKTSFFILNHEN